ncbi:MAG: hypothetical protein LBS81_03280 [Endomicrobium sp.]|nr:hypothetical protein [Endomicrobium sp.]
MLFINLGKIISNGTRKSTLRVRNKNTFMRHADTLEKSRHYHLKTYKR